MSATITLSLPSGSAASVPLIAASPDALIRAAVAAIRRFAGRRGVSVFAVEYAVKVR